MARKRPPKRVRQTAQLFDTRARQTVLVFEPSAVLVRVRERLGLTQSGLAGLLGVRRGRLAHWEQGRRPVPPELVRVLGVVAAVIADRDYDYALGCEVRGRLEDWRDDEQSN